MFYPIGRMAQAAPPDDKLAFVAVFSANSASHKKTLPLSGIRRDNDWIQGEFCLECAVVMVASFAVVLRSLQDEIHRHKRTISQA